MFFRTLAAGSILALGLTTLAAVPASALPLPVDRPSSSFRSASSTLAEIPAKPPKAKKNTKTLVIMAYTKKKDKTTPALLKKVYFDEVDRWMRWQSAGRQGEKGTVTKWLKLATNTRCSDQNAVMTRAVAAAKKAGYKPGSFKRIAVYFPLCKQLNWAGLGTMGTVGGGKYNLWINGTPELSVIAHESLHNYGLIHSASIDCGKKSLPKKTNGCTVSEYGDRFDIMGSSGLALSASAKLELGWLRSKQSKIIKSGSKTFTIAASDSTSSKLKVVRVYAGKRNYLDLEYRVPLRQDETPDPSGIQVRLVVPHQDFDDYGRELVDVLPNNSTDYASIPAGQSWTAPNKARITVVSVTGAIAKVKVQFKAPAASVPAVPATPTLASAPPEDLNLPASAIASIAPVSGNGMPVLSYDFERRDAAGAVMSFATDALGGAVLSARVGDVTYGSYQVRYRARNELGAGGFSQWSASLAVAEPLPVIAAINVENQTVPAPFTLSQLVATVHPSSAGFEISRVYFSVGSYTCEPGNYFGGPSDHYYCSSDYDATYLQPGSYVLTVTAVDSFQHTATRTAAFTVAAP